MIMLIPPCDCIEALIKVLKENGYEKTYSYWTGVWYIEIYDKRCNSSDISTIEIWIEKGADEII